ncbi:hypothetical protein AB0G54_39810, partial [Streptomyces yokosukanensis]|uniref:hypothetical protein n=1 Tax=Streptomyces yokosukanensis TaxID=67386 RepID=UPI003424D8B5
PTVTKASLTTNYLDQMPSYSYDQSNTSTTTYNAYWEGRGAVRFAYNVYGTGDATLCLRIFVNGNGYNWRTDHNCPAAA